MAQKPTSEVAAAIQCVRRAIKKCGRSTLDFFKHALKDKKEGEIEDHVDEFEEVGGGDNAHLLRRYQVPEPVIKFARAVEAHNDPVRMFPKRESAQESATA